MSYGSISDKGVVLFLFWGLIFAFLFWLLHLWIKNTKYIGYASTLVFGYVTVKCGKYLSILLKA